MALVEKLSSRICDGDPVAAATATTANKFHHCFTKSDDDGFLRCEGDAGAPVYLAAVLEYLAAEVNFTCGGFSTMAIT
ncbi:hypothetical protein Syun_018909 [Stephania yunnanensis]|uniref:Uncharacterized protein n=1 Tax=Stephania yunnanensis TaxID=152371 RepID=A0AAP0IV25_9MAGN